VVGAAVRTTRGENQAAKQNKFCLCGFCFMKPVPFIQGGFGRAISAFGASQTISKSALILVFPNLDGEESLCGCNMD
jgi:hypothetical protein